MLTVKASAKPSKINGIGLIADQKILKGTITWKFHPLFDILFDPKDVAAMSEEHRALIETYAYLSMTSGKYVYSIDDSRFANHSSQNANIDIVDIAGEPETCGVANRDIEIGEEILVNYRNFDVQDAVSNANYLKE